VSALYSRLHETVGRGISGLESHTSVDGSFRGCEHELASYYKSLLAFAVCGKIHVGAKSLLYLRTHLRNSEGELASDPPLIGQLRHSEGGLRACLF
jgi:hypothetical protein